MSEVTIREDNTEEFKKELENRIPLILEAIGIFLEGEAKLELESSPRRIDTGNLRNSITHIVDLNEEAVYIGTNVEYAIYVHEGTINMLPNRFLENALEKNEAMIRQLIESQLKS